MLVYSVSGLSQIEAKNVITPKIIMLTHGRCMDGVTCAVIAKKIWPDALCVMSSHGVINELLTRCLMMVSVGGTILISDIACSQEKLKDSFEILRQKKITLYIFDHHQTNNWLRNINLEDENVLGKIVFTSERCGAKITYDHFLPQYPQLLSPYDQLVEIVNDRDLWLRKNKFSNLFAYLHIIYGDEDFCNRFIENPDVQFVEKERILLDFYQKQQKKILHSLLESIHLKTDKQGVSYGVIYGEGDSSELLNEALKKYNLEYALLVNLHRRSVSVRSRGDFDCALYAEKFGGGGHKRASGFALTSFTVPSF